MKFSADGAEDELEFWRTVLTEFRLGKLPGLTARLTGRDGVSETIRKNVKVSGGGEEIRVLDVGSGPFGTMTSGVLSSNPVRITGVDPLANDYGKLLREAGVESPMKLVQGTAENLDQLFPADTFHFVNSDNALDHCFDPGLSLANMLRSVMPGGVVRVGVFVNEGQWTGYSGFHQWNFDAVADRIFVWNRNEVHFIDEFLSGAPYRYERSREITGLDRVERDTLIISIVKATRESHTFHKVGRLAEVARVPENNTLVIERGPDFDETKNFFVHAYAEDPSQCVSAPEKLSLACRDMPQRFSIPLPSANAALVGQYEMKRSGGEMHFRNLWEVWV